MAQAQALTTPRGREYETIYVLRPDVAPDRAQRVSTRLEEVVQREGGMLTVVENWGRRQLAYTVSSHKRAVYVYLRFVGGGRLVAEIERNLKMFDDVIKYQTVKVRDDVDRRSLKIDPEAVKFEPVVPPDEQEAEESLARTLGLEEMPREVARFREQRAGEELAEEHKAEPDQKEAEAAEAGPPTEGDEGSSQEDES